MRYLPIIFLFVFGSAFSEPDPLFQSSDILELKIQAPFSTINSERDKDKEYEGVELSYTDKTGREHTLEVKLAVRGNFRLRKETCRYSQLWINFKKGEVAGTVFENQDKIKLVVQCKKSQRYENYIIKEQLAYDLFNNISDISFRTRLANVNYINTDKEEDSWNHLAFFVEHQERMASRLEMQNVKENQVSIASLNKPQTNLVDLFMLMIANTDYSSIASTEGSCCHNVKLLLGEDGQNYPVPYDFDSSGLVDTGYAQPNPALHLNSNRQRLYRGYCQEAELLQTNINYFLEKQPVIMDLFIDSALPNNRTKRRDESFLESFFTLLKDERQRKRIIENRCRG